MLNIEMIKTPFELPEGKRRVQLAIHAGNCAINWLECASFNEYSEGIREQWQYRGEQWLEAMVQLLNGTVNEPCSVNESIILDELLEGIETRWEAL